MYIFGNLELLSMHATLSYFKMHCFNDFQEADSIPMRPEGGLCSLDPHPDPPLCPTTATWHSQACMNIYVLNKHKQSFTNIYMQSYTG